MANVWSVAVSEDMRRPSATRYEVVRITPKGFVVKTYGGERRIAGGRCLKLFTDEKEMVAFCMAEVQRKRDRLICGIAEADEFLADGTVSIYKVQAEEPGPIVLD